MNYDVIGLGNALVDMQVEVTDELISNLGFERGAMALIDEAKRNEVLKQLGSGKSISGGSAANTLYALSILGKKVGMLGSVASDELGELYQKDFKKSGVDFFSGDGSTAKNEATGTSIILISPDAQRTMLTTLGCAPFIEVADVHNIEDKIADSRILYVEGYLWDSPTTIDSVKKAMKIAKRQGCKVAFSASDSFCVERHAQDFKRILADEADIFFCNRTEASMLSGKKDVNAITNFFQQKNQCELVALTDGADGSYLIWQDKVVPLPIVEGGTLIDTTGAGDVYAAGILFDYLQGVEKHKMGKLACEMAGKIVCQYGARYHK